MTIVVTRLAGACVLLVLFSVQLFAQGGTGQISGRVSDEQGGVLPGASTRPARSSPR